MHSAYRPAATGVAAELHWCEITWSASSQVIPVLAGANRAAGE